MYLEALAVNNGWSGLIVLRLGDPHLLESGKGGKNGTANPDGVLALRWGDNLDLHGRRCEGDDFLGQTLGDVAEHGSTTGKNNVGVKILTNINITLHDGLEQSVVDTTGLLTNERWLEENFWAAETFVTNGNDVTVGKFVRLLEIRRLGGGLHLLIKVHGNVAEFLLDVTDNFTLGSGSERVTTLGEDLHHVVGQIATGKIDTKNGVGKGVTLVNWDSVRNTITRVKDGTSSTTRGVQREDGLDVDVHGWDVERLKHNLRHALTVGLWVEWGFGQKNRVLLWGNTKFVVESVMPDFLHVVPVGHDTVLNWVLQGENTTLGLRLVTDVGLCWEASVWEEKRRGRRRRKDCE